MPYSLKAIFVVDSLYFVKCVYIALLNTYTEKVCSTFEIQNSKFEIRDSGLKIKKPI